MMTDPRIEELDRQFSAPGSTLTLEQYHLKRRQFESSAPPVETPAPEATPARAGGYVTWQTLHKVCGEIPKVIGRVLRERFQKSDARVDELEKRIATLEARPTLEHRGIWNAQETYPPGTFITHSGSMWYSGIQTKGMRPGDGAYWTLVVKHGRDAR